MYRIDTRIDPRIDPRAEGGGRTRAKSGEVEGGEWRADTGRTTKGYGGGRTKRSFYFALVPPVLSYLNKITF